MIVVSTIYTQKQPIRTSQWNNLCCSLSRSQCVVVTTVTGLHVMTYGFYLKSWYLWGHLQLWDDRVLWHMACPRLKCKGSFTLDSWHDISKMSALARRSLPNMPSSSSRRTRAHKKLQSLLTICISLFFFLFHCAHSHMISQNS